MEHVYASVDIGTDTIKLVVCELYKNHLNLLAASQVPSLGLKKGLITDPELVKDSLKKAFDEVEAMLGIKIKKVIATVPSYQSEYKLVKAEIGVSGNLIGSNEIKALYKNSLKGNLNPNKEFITLVPIDFAINDKNIMKDPKGFPGTTLSFRGMLTMAPKKNLYSVASIIESLGIELIDVSLSGIGDYNCFKSETTNGGIGIIVNSGAETTTVTLYNKGVPISTKVIGIGGKDVDSDISYMYRIDAKEAKYIKEKFALADKKNCSHNDYYETVNIDGEKIKINQLEVTNIVASRLEEILSLVKNEISLLTNKPIQYIIVTGGTSNIRDFKILVTKMLGSATIIDKIKLVGARNNKYSTALGNLIYFVDTLKLKGQEYTMLETDDMEVLSSPDRHFINTSNESMLGKVFGYFFGE